MIYADNAAATRISEKVLRVMTKIMTQEYGNPSSPYKLGASAKKIVETARTEIAQALGASTSEIYFTSGGTESDNWAIKGTAYAAGKRRKKHIISTQIEHHAVLRSLESLQQHGFEITLLAPDKHGIIHPKQLTRAIRKNTGLVSVMYANNEIGTVQPIQELAEICRRKNIPFHTDAVQAIGQIPVNVKDLSVDLLSVSGHKIHGPKGVGLLYIREGVAIEPLLNGGTQERRQRAGTENVAAIAGLAVAIRDAVAGLKRRTASLAALQERFIKGLLTLEGSHIHGDRYCRLPGNVNVSFDNASGESLVLMLDKQGICCSTGSACTSGSLEPSHVLLALGLSTEQALGALRFTFSEENTKTEVDTIFKALQTALKKLRGVPPSSECCCAGGCCS